MHSNTSKQTQPLTPQRPGRAPRLVPVNTAAVQGDDGERWPVVVERRHGCGSGCNTERCRRS